MKYLILKNVVLSFLLTLCLGGCTGSPVWYRNHENRQETTINGKQYWVVVLPDRVGAGRVDVSFYEVPNYPALEYEHKLAIEKVTGKKVLAIREMAGNTWVWEAVVEGQFPDSGR